MLIFYVHKYPNIWCVKPCYNSQNLSRTFLIFKNNVANLPIKKQQQPKTVIQTSSYLWAKELAKRLLRCIYENCSAWTTTKAYAPYVDERQDKYTKDICSPWSYGLEYCILYLDRALLGVLFQKIEMAFFLGICSTFN